MHYQRFPFCGWKHCEPSGSMGAGYSGVSSAHRSSSNTHLSSRFLCALRSNRAASPCDPPCFYEGLNAFLLRRHFGLKYFLN